MKQEDIPGQKALKEVFAELVDNDQLPHALLIRSKQGGSGLAMALLLAQYLLCENRSDGNPCGTCPSCVKNERLSHPDVHYVSPVNKNQKVKKIAISEYFLEEWRSLIGESPFIELMDWYTAIGIENKQGFMGSDEITALRQKLSLRSFEGKQRVFIIWQADRMNQEFANKILKSLEEPSAETVFILVTENPSRLLPTVLSRVQMFSEEPLSAEELSHFLQTRYQIPEPEAINTAFRSEGNISHAFKDLHHDGDPWLNEFRDFMRLAYMRDIKSLYEWSERMAKNSRDAQRQFVKTALVILDRCYRQGWLADNLPFEGEEQKFYTSFSPFVNYSNIRGFMEDFEKASYHIERNVNGKIVWFDTAINAIRLVHQGKKAAAEA